MTGLEIRYSYGYWDVEIIGSQKGHALHEWLVVALWRAWRRSVSATPTRKD